MKTFWDRKIFGVVFAILLTGFTVYAALDTFVIPRSYSAERPTATPTRTAAPAPEVTPSQSGGSETTPAPDLSEPPATSDGAVGTRGSYSDDNISIQIREYREYDTSIYVADITLSSCEYLKTAFAEDTFGKNIKELPSEMAARNNAILAINGDFYGMQAHGFVVHNGVLYRDVPSTREALIVYADGTMEVVTEAQADANALMEKGAVQMLSFGPGLVRDGAVAVTTEQEVRSALASNPRTAIGYYGPNHFLFVVSDGRTEESAGLTLYQLATFMKDRGVTMAYNLDGGGSSTMIFQGEFINVVTDGWGFYERSVSDLVYIGY